MSIRRRLQEKSMASTIDFVDLNEIDCVIKFSKPLDVTRILNSRVEEFITLTYFNEKLYIMGFIGRTCIMRECPIKVEKNVGNKCFSFSLKREFLKILDGKDELVLNLSEGYLHWTFKYGDGIIIRKMKPTSSIYEIKKYLDFILNLGMTNPEGKVNALEIRNIHRKLEKLEPDPMSRNVILGRGYISAVLPSYAMFLPSGTDSDTLITESIISNLPKKSEEFEIKVSRGFTGLIGITNGISYIFPTLTTRDDIEPYTKLRINWLGELKGLHNAMKVVTFGDKNTEIKVSFHQGGQTVAIQEMENENNKFVGVSKVVNDGNIVVSSILQEFKDMVMIGTVADRGREHIKALSFEGGEICLLR